MLYIFGGLPSSGKSILSQHLAKELGAMHIRIDSIEQYLRSYADMEPVGVAGYVSAYAIAKDNLELGHTVIAESVNPIQITRDAWKAVASEAGVPFLEIEVVCSDLEQHKARYLSRVADIEGLVYGPWEDVLNREYENWSSRNLLIDTASKTMAESCEDLMNQIERQVA
jgi:predicted kinase